MTSATRQRPERIATDAGHRAASPGAKTGGSGERSKATDGKRPKRLKLAVLILVLLVAGGGIAKFTVLAPPASGSKPPAKGPVIALDDMTLNLTDGHYLRLKISLQTTKGTSAELDSSQAQQLIIDTYSNLSVAQLTGAAARERAKQQLLNKLKQAYPKQMLDVYYTGFVMTS